MQILMYICCRLVNPYHKSCNNSPFETIITAKIDC